MKHVPYIVEGRNFVATLPIDEDIFTNDGTLATNAYLEAATKTLEYIFRHGSNNPGDFNLMMKNGQTPGVGLIMSICKDGELGDPNKLHYAETAVAAQNAGCLELVRHFTKTGWKA